MKEIKNGGRHPQEAAKIASENIDTKLKVWSEEHKSTKEGNKDMNGFNRIVLMGKLTSDPKLRQISSGKSVANLGLAISEEYKNKEGEISKRICFVDIVTWGKQADACGEYLKKGSSILVEGRLQLDSWEAPDGQKRSKHRVNADSVKFLSCNNAYGDKQPQLAGAVDDNTPF